MSQPSSNAEVTQGGRLQWNRILNLFSLSVLCTVFMPHPTKLLEADNFLSSVLDNEQAACYAGTLSLRQELLR